MGPRFTLALVLLLAVTACGSSSDPDPEKVGESFVVTPGELVERDLHTDDTYPWLDFHDWDEDVDGLPAGFDYDTYDIYFDGLDRLWVEYDLYVAPWVEPGNYRFTVTYDFYDIGSIFREEIEFRFRVEVVDSGHGGGLLLRVQQGVEPEAAEEGVDSAIRIEDGD